MPSRRQSRHTGPVYLAIQFDASRQTTDFRVLTTEAAPEGHPTYDVFNQPAVINNRDLDAAALRRTAAVVRDRRDVANRLHLDANRLQGADGGLTARAGPGHANLHGAQPHRLGGVARVDGGLRRGKRRSLARALVADGAGAGPRDDVAFGVGDRHDGVVERRLDVRQPGVHDALLAALLERLLFLAGRFLCAGRCGFGLCHGWLHRLLLGHSALARAFPRARVRARALAVDRQAAAMPQPAVAADFHQPLDVERDLLPEVAFDPSLLLDHPGDLADVVFRK